MDPKIWFIKNMTHEGAGLFSSFAERRKIPFSIVDLHEGENFPKLNGRDAVVILGGPNSANDRDSKILNEIDSIAQLLKEGIPCLGICLGLQLLVKAAGGSVYRNSVKEIGFRDPAGEWFEVEKTDAGKKDPLLSGIADEFKVFQLHGETVELAPSMICLARGKYCANQIVKIQSKAYGVQGHVELNRGMFKDWLTKDEDMKKMDSVKLRNDFTLIQQELERSSEVMFENFLKISGILM